MANIYSNMTQKEKDNERKYLTNLQNSGNAGEKDWATNQLKQLNSVSTPSYNQTWESGGRTYVGGVDVGPAGTKVDASNTAASYKQSYGDMGDKIQTNPYEDEIDRIREAYERQQNQIREQNRIAVEQGTNRLNAQKANINQAAEDNARQAYIMHMQAKKALPQQLVNQGATGGMTETANLGLQTTYQNNLNDINRNKINAIQEIDNAIVDLKNTGNLATVEQVLANNQAALDSYMSMLDKGVSYNQWANQYNSNRADNAYTQAYKEREYADMLKQQALENELALQTNNLKQSSNNQSKTESSTNGNVISPIGDIANYINNQMGGDFVEYNKDLKKYSIGNWVSKNQKDQIVKNVALGIKDGTLGDEALDALINLGYSTDQIKAIVDQM